MNETEAERRLAELAEFQAAVRSPAGQTIMLHLRRVTGAGKSSFRPGDPHATAFCCGLRDAYLLMRRDAEIDLAELEKTIERKEKKNGIVQY